MSDIGKCYTLSFTKKQRGMFLDYHIESRVEVPFIVRVLLVDHVETASTSILTSCFVLCNMKSFVDSSALKLLFSLTSSLHIGIYCNCFAFSLRYLKKFVKHLCYLNKIIFIHTEAFSMKSLNIFSMSSLELWFTNSFTSEVTRWQNRIVCFWPTAGTIPTFYIMPACINLMLRLVLHDSHMRCIYTEQII